MPHLFMVPQWPMATKRDGAMVFVFRWSRLHFKPWVDVGFPRDVPGDVVTAKGADDPVTRLMALRETLYDWLPMSTASIIIFR